MTKKKMTEVVEEVAEEASPFDKPLYTGHSDGHVLHTSEVTDDPEVAEEAEATDEPE